MPDQEAEDGLVEYFRCISGEHSDWDEYREAMRKQGKSLIRITVTEWGPIATGGFPPDRVPVLTLLWLSVPCCSLEPWHLGPAPSSLPTCCGRSPRAPAWA